MDSPFNLITSWSGIAISVLLGIAFPVVFYKAYQSRGDSSFRWLAYGYAVWFICLVLILGEGIAIRVWSGAAGRPGNEAVNLTMTIQSWLQIVRMGGSALIAYGLYLMYKKSQSALTGPEHASPQPDEASA